MYVPIVLFLLMADGGQKPGQHKLMILKYEYDHFYVKGRQERFVPMGAFDAVALWRASGGVSWEPHLVRPPRAMAVGRAAYGRGRGKGNYVPLLAAPSC
jgi:hypothetical protein